jgi:hypothetical protein
MLKSQAQAWLFALRRLNAAHTVNFSVLKRLIDNGTIIDAFDRIG